MLYCCLHFLPFRFHNYNNGLQWHDISSSEPTNRICRYINIVPGNRTSWQNTTGMNGNAGIGINPNRNIGNSSINSKIVYFYCQSLRGFYSFPFASLRLDYNFHVYFLFEFVLLNLDIFIAAMFLCFKWQNMNTLTDYHGRSQISKQSVRKRVWLSLWRYIKVQWSYDISTIRCVFVRKPSTFSYHHTVNVLSLHSARKQAHQTIQSHYSVYDLLRKQSFKYKKGGNFK